MKLVSRIENYLNYDDFKIIITNNSIYIVNYLEVVDFSCSNISIKCKNGIMNITGKDLIISKMLVSEVEVIGNFRSITYV